MWSATTRLLMCTAFMMMMWFNIYHNITHILLDTIVAHSSCWATSPPTFIPTMQAASDDARSLADPAVAASLEGQAAALRAVRPPSLFHSRGLRNDGSGAALFVFAPTPFNQSYTWAQAQALAGAVGDPRAPRYRQLGMRRWLITQRDDVSLDGTGCGKVPQHARRICIIIGQWGRKWAPLDCFTVCALLHWTTCTHTYQIHTLDGSMTTPLSCRLASIAKRISSCPTSARAACRWGRAWTTSCLTWPPWMPSTASGSYTTMGCPPTTLPTTQVPSQSSCSPLLSIGRVPHLPYATPMSRRCPC